MTETTETRTMTSTATRPANVCDPHARTADYRPQGNAFQRIQCGGTGYRPCALVECADGFFRWGGIDADTIERATRRARCAFDVAWRAAPDGSYHCDCAGLIKVFGKARVRRCSFDSAHQLQAWASSLLRSVGGGYQVLKPQHAS